MNVMSGGHILIIWSQGAHNIMEDLVHELTRLAFLVSVTVCEAM